MKPDNATFMAFKPSGKWYTMERGVLSEDTFGKAYSPPERREKLLASNGGKYPGLSSTGSEFFLVVIPDEEVSFGFPLMLHPRNGGE